MPAPTDVIESFIARWSAASGSERANYQLFIGELCELLGLPRPEPALADAGENAYCFERNVVFRHGDGTQSHGFIDCYRRGTFVMEAKKLRVGGARAFDDAMLRARSQAESYARALPADEGRAATWAEIDFDAGIWTVPAEHMKMNREHRVPLSKAAVAVLEAMPRMGDLIFPGAKPGKPLSDMSLTAVLRRMKRRDITVHGFRSSFRDWCAESVANAFPREVCEHALAHSLPDKVEAAYRRGDLIEKRTLLMKAWADYCAKPATEASVTPIRGKQKTSKRSG